MTERLKNTMTVDVDPPSQWPDVRKQDGHGQTSKSKGYRRRDDLEMQDHLLVTFREIIESSIVDIRKEELAKGFTKIEEGRDTV